VIEIENLTKRYGETLAVGGVSLEARPGEVTGLLGPNGAGKSTTLACVSGLREPTSGRVRVLGHDVVREKRLALEQLGVVPQELALYDDLNARENLEYWGAAYGLRGAVLRNRVSDVLEQIGLGDRSSERVSRFSGGMQRRLNFGCALVHSPRVLLLDEPTVGVDPQSRVRLLELVRSLARAGMTVLYTTHHMQEAEELCDRLAIVDHGKVIASGTQRELHARLGGRDLLQLGGVFVPEAARAALEALQIGDAQGRELEIVSLDERSLQLSLRDASARLASIFAALTRAGCEVRETTLRQPSLESLFIALTGKELRE
jgi:ABC-2 type transport system ATP-binding protein